MYFAEGLSRPEGPVVLADGSWLVVEMGSDRGSITQIKPDGGDRRIVARTGRPNGLALDANGNVWVAESLRPSLLRVTLAGAIDVISTGCAGEPFLFPNDLCFGPDGLLYMTDSGIKASEFAPDGVVRPDYEDLHYDGRVYRIEPGTGSITTVDRGLLFPNGIAFGPDGCLYVNETVSGNVYRYSLTDDSQCGPREVFANVIDPQAPPGFAGPDGMAFGADGDLYVTVVGHGQVAVVNGNGGVYRRLLTDGEAPTNVAFGLPGDKKIYVTEYDRGRVETFDVGVDGLPLHQAPAGDTPDANRPDTTRR